MKKLTKYNEVVIIPEKELNEAGLQLAISAINHLPKISDCPMDRFIVTILKPLRKLTIDDIKNCRSAGYYNFTFYIESRYFKKWWHLKEIL